MTVLHTAAMGNQPQVIYYFVTKYGLNIDCKDNLNMTPLHYAVISG